MAFAIISREGTKGAPQSAESEKILGWTGANSTEFDESASHPVVIFMPEIDKENMGGTMRLGARDTAISKLEDGSKSISEILYSGASSWFREQSKESDGTVRISERHRHRYEVNPELVDQIDAVGLKFVGKDFETRSRMEIAELSRSVHPYYVGCQYHPEFQSRPLGPSPPFLGLILAASGMLDDFLLKHS